MRALAAPSQRWLGHAPALPDEVTLGAALEEALTLRWRKDADRWLDAKEPGELFFHATLTQDAIDRVGHGPAALFVVGDDLFEAEIRPEQGHGNALAGEPGVSAGGRDAPNMRRVHQGEFGAPEAFGCSECHFQGGLNGAGTQTQNGFLRGDGNHTMGADERNPPHLLGLGPVAALAAEMTRELQAQREGARAQALLVGASVAVDLLTKGVAFGRLTVAADGAVDTSAVEGVDGDLVVKPFGWKGHQPNLRRAAEEAFHIHLGMVSSFAQEQLASGLLSQADYGNGDMFDVDRDGVTLEVDDGMITTMVFYLSQLEIPVQRVPHDAILADAFARGSAVFGQVGCARCHIPELLLDNPVVETRPDTALFQSSPTLQVNVARDGEHPKLEAANAALMPSYRVNLMSDLKRHDMGPGLATPTAQGNIPASVFLTRPLWGLADTAPYLHDGRANTVEDAIMAHGGEAEESATAFGALAVDDRRALLVFLAGLTRQPRLFIP